MAEDADSADSPKNHKDNPQGKQNGDSQQTLTQGIPSITRTIADAVVIKNENLFFLTKPDGAVPLEVTHGFGLYYHDCRYLNGYEMKMAGTELNALVSNATAGFAAVFELANPEIELENGQHITRDQISFKWERIIDAKQLTLHDLLTINNFGRQDVDFPLSFSFRCDFEDVFAVRGLLQIQPGKVNPPTWENGSIQFLYEGEDGIYRNLSIHFDPQPDQMDGTQVQYHVHLDSRENREILVSLVISEDQDRDQIQNIDDYSPNLKKIESYFKKESQDWLEHQTKISTDSLLLNSIMDRSLHDVRTLRNQIDGEDFFSAGVPWYVTLFGRDSLITGLQMLAYNPDIAAQTLRILAKYQGSQVNDYRDEEPGKILHELRIGELAHLNKIPHTPYYGTIDATPLFLILMSQYAYWTGDLSLFEDLRSNVDRALDWMTNYGDADHDGYLEYKNKSKQGVVNHGWKDSGESIVNADGSLATQPIELVEVQGYAYLARLGMAKLFDQVGEENKAMQLRMEAQQLCEKFNRDFWLEDLGIYALALQADNKPCAVVASNPGQALWSGIADPQKAGRTVQRLMQKDMFNGWGIRTLSANDQCYNPTGYHIGTVWPHDNAIIMAGFRRYRYDQEAMRIFKSIVEAAMNFEHYRLPEVFAGFNRQDYNVPVRYPVACHPQAWSAGSIPFMLTTLLGLEADAFEHKLRIVRPILPDFVDRIQVRALRVGDATVGINFERTSEDHCAVDVVSIGGELDVVVES